MTIADLLAGLVSYCWVFVAIGIGMAFHRDEDESGKVEDFDFTDPEFLVTARSFFNDILRFVSHRTHSSEDEDVADDDSLEFLFDVEDEDDSDSPLFSSGSRAEDGAISDSESSQYREETESRANFSGAFFKNRNYSPDVYDEENNSEISPAGSDAGATRWRRQKNDDDQDSSDIDNSKSFDEDVNHRRRVNDDFFESERAEEDDEGLLDDDSAPLEKRIERLRARLAEGDDSVRLELVQLLVEFSGRMGKGEVSKSDAALDLAQRVLDEGETLFGEELEEAECHIALQRAVFHMRNDMKPPFELVLKALQRTREWYQASGSSASRTLLARAYLLHGQRLLASGSGASALASLEKARALFTSSDDICEEVNELEDSSFSSVGFVLVAEAEAYNMIGDTEKYVSKLREAAAVFDRFSSKRFFLSHKASVLAHLAVTLRDAGRQTEASEALEEAISAEERLYSYDDSKYFVGLSQLLRLQSELRYKEGDETGAFALLDRAETVLLTSLSADVPLKRRVFAYVQLSQVLRGRAGMYLLRRRNDLARRDALKALKYLATATEKDDSLNPGPGVTSLFAFIYDLATMDEAWEEAERIQVIVEDIFERLTPRERQPTDPMYAELLLHMHMVNASGKRFPEAFETTRRAIALMNQRLESDESREDNQCRFLLAKSLYQLGSYQFILKRQVKETLASFARIEEVFEESDLLSEDDESRQARGFYVEFLWRYACVQWQLKDMNGARRAIVRACRIVVTDIESGMWGHVSTLKKLTYVTTRMADTVQSGEFFLRLTRFWLRYVQRIRRRFLEREYDVTDEAVERLNYKILSAFDETLLYLTLSRIRFFVNHEWHGGYARYMPRELRALIDNSLSSDEPTPWAVFLQAESELPEKFTLTTAYEALNRFVTSCHTDAPGKLLLWYELHKCVRSLERQIENGSYGHIKIFVYLLKQLVDLYSESNEPELATAELAFASRVFETQASRLDSAYADSFGEFTGSDTNMSTSPQEVANEFSTSSDELDEFNVSDSSMSMVTDEDNHEEPHELFWNGAFYVGLFKLASLIRVVFGKGFDCDYVSSPYLESKDENEATMWLTPRGDASSLFASEADHDKFEEESNSELESKEPLVEKVTRNDYSREDLDSSSLAVISREFERIRFLGMKMSPSTPWQYLQNFFFLKSNYNWLVGIGRREESETLVRGEIERLEEESKGNVLAHGLLWLFYDLLGSAALDPPRNVELAREIYGRLLARKESSKQLPAVFLPKTLFGLTHIRLALIAGEEGDIETESHEFRLAAKEIMCGVTPDSLNFECFEEATKLLERFFNSDSLEDQRIARWMFRQYEQSFDCSHSSLVTQSNQNDDQATQALTYSWITFIRAAGYYDEQRKCFTIAKRLYQKSELLWSFLSDHGKRVMPIEFYSARISVAAFFSRYGLANVGRRILEECYQSCAALAHRADDLELSSAVQSSVRKLRLQLRFALAEHRTFRGGGTPEEMLSGLVDEIEATPDYIVFLSEAHARRRTFWTRIVERYDLKPRNPSVSDVKDSSPALWAGLAFMSRLFTAFTVGRNATDKIASVRRELRRIRELAGSMSYSLYLCHYYWADYACRLATSVSDDDGLGSCVENHVSLNCSLTFGERSRYLGSAIHSAGRVWRRRYLPPESHWGVNEELCGKMILIDSMKLEAFGRLERHKSDDVSIASKILDAALGECEKLFRDKFFVFRPIFAELLALKARVLEFKGQRKEALEIADRAVGIIERCELKGVVNWLPALRKGLTTTIRRLRGGE